MRTSIAAAAAVFCVLAALFAATARPASPPNVSQVRAALQSEGATVNLYWPANSNFAAFIHNVLVPGFESYTQRTYGIQVQLNVLDASGGDGAFLTKLQANGNQSGFGIDVARTAPSAQLLGDFGLLEALNTHARIVPNLSNVDAAGKRVFTEAGLVYGAPIYRPTMSLFYNASLVKKPPTSLAALLTFAKANPNKVSYEDPRSTTGTGSGVMFLLAAMHAFGSQNDPSTWSKGWSYLKALQQVAYPEPATGDQLVDLFQRGAVTVMPYWNDGGLYARDNLKISGMKNILLKDPFPIRYTPFVVPAHAAHKTAALLLVNYVLGQYIQARLGSIMHQIPSISAKAAGRFPANTFGFPLSEIESDTFPAYNSVPALNAVNTLTQQYGPQVLGR